MTKPRLIANSPNPQSIGGDRLIDGSVLFDKLAPWEQAGTGAVPRHIENKVRERVSVLDFGAVGDGVADDTVAIQSALDSFPKVLATGAGGNLFFPTGRYLVSTPLIVPFGVNIEGTGDYGVRIIAASNFSGNAIIYVKLGATDYNNSDISFLSIDCNNRPGVSAIKYESAYSNVTLSDLYIREVNPGAIGLDMGIAERGVTVCESVLLKNIYVNSQPGLTGVTNAQPLIRLERFQESTLINVKGLGNVNFTPYNGSVSLQLVSCRGVTVINGGIAFCETGIKITTNQRSSSGIGLFNVTYEGNTATELYIRGTSEHGVVKVYQYAPRYEFPRPLIGVDADYCVLSEFHVANRDVVLGSNTSSNLVVGTGGTLTAASGARYGHIECPNGVTQDFSFSPNVSIKSNNTPYTKYSVQGRTDGSYIWRWAASSTVDNGFQLLTKGDRTAILVKDDGSEAQLGFFGNGAISKPVVSGSVGGNTALSSLCAALDNLGLITDNTTS